MQVDGGIMLEYKEVLCQSFFFKFYHYVNHQLTGKTPDKYDSIIQPWSRPLSSGTQHYDTKKYVGMNQFERFFLALCR